MRINVSRFGILIHTGSSYNEFRCEFVANYCGLISHETRLRLTFNVITVIAIEGPFGPFATFLYSQHKKLGARITFRGSSRAIGQDIADTTIDEILSVQACI